MQTIGDEAPGVVDDVAVLVCATIIGCCREIPRSAIAARRRHWRLVTAGGAAGSTARSGVSRARRLDTVTADASHTGPTPARTARDTLTCRRGCGTKCLPQQQVNVADAKLHLAVGSVLRLVTHLLLGYRRAPNPFLGNKIARS